MPGPLNGLKVLDFSTLLPGPYGTMMMADLGAEVMRVVAPGPSNMRHEMPTGEPNPIDQTLNRNKRSVTVNMKDPASREIIRRLVERADVVVEQFRPGVMQRLGWDYPAAKAVNPKIIYCALTGYGQNGPYRDRAGHDLNYLAMSGILSYTGKKEVGPTPVGIQIADLCAGSYNLVVGVLAALYHLEKTGEGQFIDVAMLDGSIALNAISGSIFMRLGVVPDYETELLNGGTLYDIYRTKDGRYLSVGGLEPKFLADFLRAIGKPELAPPNMSMHFMPNKTEAKRIVTEVIAGKTYAEWREIFAKHDACVEPVLNLKEMSEHPQTQARGMIVEMDNARGGKVRQIAHPIKYSATEPEYRHAGKPAGAETDEILKEAGFTADEIKSFRDKAVV
ncbi:CoA transferase [Candidatus Sumerlaeota bacterium]|nr:CoA transferase [Candidatus Sumerlaeota bacterium]